MTESAPAASFPPLVCQIAAETGLGVPLKEYRARFTSEVVIYSFLILLAAGFAVGAVLALMAAPAAGLVAALVLAGFIIILILYYFHDLPGAMWRIIRWRRVRLYVCADGLLFLLQQTRYRGMRWDEVVSITQAITSKGISYQVSPPVIVQAANGTKFVLHRYFSNAAELSNTVVQEISRHLLPKYTARYSEGETVSFGRLGVNQQSLALGDEQVPWSQIKAIRVVQGWIEVIASGAQTGTSTIWRKFNPTALPNSFVFLTMTETILQHRTPAERG